MKRNIGKNLKGTKGITLVALVVTIIVLLILAGVALSSVLSQDGIFSRAEQATDKYGEAKAKETLELALGEAQMRKYESGLTEEQLDEQIKKVGSLISKEDPNSNNQLVIVDGHIFEIDRSVPKIVDYKGPADGIIITAQVSQNGNWINPTATVTGTITKYGGGTVISSSATATNGVTIPTNFPTVGGSYTISNITADTDITINAQDSEGHDPVTEVIKVRLVRDNTPPVISEATAILSEKTEILNGMKIRISVRATDNESGLQSLTYSVEPNTVKDRKATGTLTSGIPIEIEATEPGNYTVTFTAKDNAGKTATATAGPVRASDAMLVEDVKSKVNVSNIREYMGTKVDYQSPEGGIWRIFYYDVDGDFGQAGTVYLKRDKQYISSLSTKTGNTGEAVTRMKKMNPLWAKSSAHNQVDLNSEKACVWLCNPEEWNKYSNSDYSTYAIGSPSLEIYIKAYNQWKENSNALVCKLDDTSRKMGYLVGVSGSYSYENGFVTADYTLDRGPNKSDLFGTDRVGLLYLATPSSVLAAEGYNPDDILLFAISGDHRCISYENYSTGAYFAPIVPLDK